MKETTLEYEFKDFSNNLDSLVNPVARKDVYFIWNQSPSLPFDVFRLILNILEKFNHTQSSNSNIYLLSNSLSPDLFVGFNENGKNIQVLRFHFEDELEVVSLGLLENIDENWINQVSYCQSKKYWDFIHDSWCYEYLIARTLFQTGGTFLPLWGTPNDQSFYEPRFTEIIVQEPEFCYPTITGAWFYINFPQGHSGCAAFLTSLRTGTLNDNILAYLCNPKFLSK